MEQWDSGEHASSLISHMIVIFPYAHEIVVSAIPAFCIEVDKPECISVTLQFFTATEAEALTASSVLCTCKLGGK